MKTTMPTSECLAFPRYQRNYPSPPRHLPTHQQETGLSSPPRTPPCRDPPASEGRPCSARSTRCGGTTRARTLLSAWSGCSAWGPAAGAGCWNGAKSGRHHHCRHRHCRGGETRRQTGGGKLAWSASPPAVAGASTEGRFPCSGSLAGGTAAGTRSPAGMGRRVGAPGWGTGRAAGEAPVRLRTAGGSPGAAAMCTTPGPGGPGPVGRGAASAYSAAQTAAVRRGEDGVLPGHRAGG